MARLKTLGGVPEQERMRRVDKIIIMALVIGVMALAYTAVADSLEVGYVLPVSEVANEGSYQGFSVKAELNNTEHQLFLRAEYQDYSTPDYNIGVDEYDMARWMLGGGRYFNNGTHLLMLLNNQTYQLAAGVEGYFGKSSGYGVSYWHEDRYKGEITPTRDGRKHSRDGLRADVWMEADHTRLGVSYALNNIGHNGNYVRDEVKLYARYYF